MDRKSIVLVAGAVLALVAGMAAQYCYPTAESSPVDVVVTLLGALLIFSWYHLDSTRAGYRRSKVLNIAVILIAIIALPYYFFRSRGAKRGLVATGLFLLTLLGFVLLSFVGQLIVHFGVPR